VTSGPDTPEAAAGLGAAVADAAVAPVAAVDQLRAALRESTAAHRVQAFIHHWLTLLEHPATDAEPLRELIADDLAMTLSDGRVIGSFNEVAAWYQGVTSGSGRAPTTSRT
jgi:hypothetical protein